MMTLELGLKYFLLKSEVKVYCKTTHSAEGVLFMLILLGVMFYHYFLKRKMNNSWI